MRIFLAFTKWAVLRNCFLNDLTVKNESQFNFYKKKTVRQLDVRSHMTQGFGDTRLFEVIHFADLTTRNIYVIDKLYFSLKSCINNSVTREKVIVLEFDLILWFICFLAMTHLFQFLIWLLLCLSRILREQKVLNCTKSYLVNYNLENTTPRWLQNPIIFFIISLIFNSW